MMQSRNGHDWRTRLVLGAGVSAALGLGGWGCEKVDCDEFRCHAVETALAQYFIDYIACCENPGMIGCDGLDGRYDLLFREIREGYSACLDRNWNRLREIWDEIRRLRLLRNTVGDVLAYLCHDMPFLMGRNTTVVFSSADTFDFDCVFEPVGGPQPIGPWSELPGFINQVRDRPGFLHAPVMFQSTYACAPGATILVDTWLGRERIDVTGGLTLVHGLQELDSVECSVTQIRSFNLQLTGESVHGELAFDSDQEGNLCVFDGDGGGLFSGTANVQLASWDVPEVRFEEIFGQRFQVEIPIATRDGNLVCAPDGPIDGLDFLPPTPEAKQAHLEAVAILNGAGGVAGDDPCLEQGRQRVETLQALFGSCYPPALESPDN
ncbi:MAG: hypothetical protein MK085_12865 [Phycisphaerales bacterium]|nr:hypothetical protein [Phycisphaerales bacterium]